MKKLLNAAALVSIILLISGCFTVSEKLPSEDIEVLERYSDTIAILRNSNISPNSEAKYEAARFLIRHVDLHFTRETKTVNNLFYHRDAQVDGLHTETPTFTFQYQYQNNYVRIRFFTCRMFVTRVEITEK